MSTKFNPKDYVNAGTALEKLTKSKTTLAGLKEFSRLLFGSVAQLQLEDGLRIGKVFLACADPSALFGHRHGG